MDRFSRSFKILNAINDHSKENNDTEKEDTKMSHPNKIKPKNIRILSNICLNPNNFGQETSAILNDQNDISKGDKISEESELSLSICNLQTECAKTKKLLETEGMEIWKSMSLDEYLPPNENITHDIFPTEDNIDKIVEEIIQPDNNANFEQIIFIERENNEDFSFKTNEPSDVANNNGNFNITTAEMLQAVEVQSIPFGHNVSIEDSDRADHGRLNGRKELSDEEWAGNSGSNTEQDSSEAEFVTSEDATLTEEGHSANDREGRKRKRAKNRLSDPKTWEYNRNKKKREEGLSYLGRKENKLVAQKDERRLKQRCLCRKEKSKNIQCFKISEEERLSIFKSFWNLTWNEKKIYVSSRVIKKKTKRARHRKNENDSRRDYSLQYFVDKQHERIRVCKTMFSNTLGMSGRTISIWVRDDREATKEKANKETKTDNGRHLKSAEKRLGVQDFFNHLPKLESHYCRKSTTKLYLEPQFKTKSELYSFYKENWCKERHLEPVSLTLFVYVFEEMNLSIFSPKKDECDLCVGYRTKNIQQEEYDIHILKKEEARSEKDKDKDSHNRVFTVDLQSVLLCPKSNVSALYYRTKLIVHNFTKYI